jgi:TetR/AcrR family transcriptional regulator, cholesterol catabolism regulator
MEKALENIIRKVSQLYLKYGIKSVSMDDVARELGMSKKTLYQYVTDKNDLVQKVVDYEIVVKRNCFECACYKDKNAIDQIFEVSKILDAYNTNYNPAIEFDLRKYYPDSYQKVFTARRQTMMERVLENLALGQKDGLYRAEMDIEIVAKLHVSRMESVFVSDIFSLAELSSNKVYNEIFLYHLYGVCSEKGLEYLKTKLLEQKSLNE